jgi:hypothetical protein
MSLPVLTQKLARALELIKLRRHARIQTKSNRTESDKTVLID